MSRERDEIIAERQRIKAEYKGLFDEVAALLFRYDPLGINFESNTDEYEPEVGTILPRLRNCYSAEDVNRAVHEEFVRWFGSDSAGLGQHYEEISKEIWNCWQKFNAQ